MENTGIQAVLSPELQIWSLQKKNVRFFFPPSHAGMLVLSCPQGYIVDLLPAIYVSQLWEVTHLRLTMAGCLFSERHFISYDTHQTLKTMKPA